MTSAHVALQPAPITSDHLCVAQSSLRNLGPIGGTKVVALSGNDAGYARQEKQKEKARSNMVKMLLGAAALAATAYAFAHAARVGVACSGENQAKAESSVEAMVDSPAKFMAQREIAQAQDALLKNNMGGCAMHFAGR